MTAPGEPLVETKLRAPRRRRGVVRRDRLALGGAGTALTLVSAPAGFGKTTLLTEWLAEGAHAAAWLSLDARDNDPARFWSHLIAALQLVNPEIGAAALPALHADPNALETVATMVVNDLDTLVDELVLVLDDYHVIEAPSIHESVAFVLDHLPPQVHLVIAGRSDPPLPLARMRAGGELNEIRAADLRFTTDEAAAYFADSMHITLSPEQVERLETRTEGWIAALQLAALSLQGRDDVSGFITGFSGDDRFVVDYLVEEVLDRQPTEVRDFLLRTSILARLTGPLCDAVTGRDGGAAMLETLERANLFVVPLDDQRRWYRYHHLFGDVLRARLMGDPAEDIAELHRRASAWFEANGDTDDAVEHALAGADFENAARIVELAAPALRQARQEDTLRRWLEGLPDDLYTNRPVLTLALVGARMSTGDTHGVEQLLRNAEHALRTESPPTVFDEAEFATIPAQIEMYRAALALLDDDPAATLAHTQQLFELTDPTDRVRLGAASALTGLAQWRQGDLETARQFYIDAVEHFVSLNFVSDALGCSLALADLQRALGRLHDARQTLERGLDLARAQPGLRGTADMHVALAEIELELDDLDAAARRLQAAREHGPAAGLPQNPYRSRVASALLLDAHGDFDGALQLLDEAERVYNTDFSPSVRPIPAIRARVRLRQGDVDAARRWATASGRRVDDEPDYVHEYEYVTLARVMLAAGDDPSPLLDRVLDNARSGGREGVVIETLVLLAQARDDAAALDEARVLAAREGYRRVFATDTTLPQTRPSVALVDPLSERELDVLRLLRSDLSGPDIARELHVSLNTFRTHTKNIYMKLAVNNRREAVTRATELGL